MGEESVESNNKEMKRDKRRQRVERWVGVEVRGWLVEGLFAEAAGWCGLYLGKRKSLVRHLHHWQIMATVVNEATAAP